MLLWVLCLKLWWLLLPVGTLQHPAVQDLQDIRVPRDASLSSRLNVRDTASTIDQRDFEITPLLIFPDGSRSPPPGSGPAPDGTIISPFWMRYDGPGVLNASYVPGSKTFSFDWEYPPYVARKLFILKGDIDLDTTETEIYVEILGFPLGDFVGNLNDGFRIDVNVAVAKGYIVVYLVRAQPKDQVWLAADLRLPLRQHFYKKIHMFDLPHRDTPRMGKPASTDTPVNPPEASPVAAKQISSPAASPVAPSIDTA
ncbi:MAG: hypothetical protein Q9220_002494 [cf. Caloplaca sp. 1 TL-2023]